MKNKFSQILNIGIIMAIVLILCFLFQNGCTQPDDTIHLLEQQGYTDVQITGWRPFMAGEDDTFSTGFRARARNGDIVTGAVTSGLMKGKTIRFD